MAIEKLQAHALIQLRGTDGPVCLARRALEATGEDANRAAVKSLANYFSRIFHGGVPQVGLEMLRLLAIAMEYQSLASFLADWEWANRGEALPFRGYAWARASDKTSELHKKTSAHRIVGSQALEKNARLPHARKRSHNERAQHLEAYDVAATIEAFKAILTSTANQLEPYTRGAHQVAESVDHAHVEIRPAVEARRPRKSPGAAHARKTSRRRPT